VSDHRVTIVIPTFNRANFLRQTIQSAVDQTEYCEIVVANHGSTDHTDDVVAEFGDRVFYVRRETDFGPHYCWLDGVMHATGEFVHLQYDDDWIKPTYVEKCMALMAPDVGCVFCETELFDDTTNQVTKTLFKDWLPGTGVFSTRRCGRRMSRKLISPAALIFRKSELIDALYQGNLPLSKNHHHGVGPDCLVTLLALLRYPKQAFVAEPLAVFRRHNASITVDAQSSRETALRLKNAYREVRRYYREQKFLKKWRAFIGLLPNPRDLTDRLPRSRELRKKK
jgi:glycosyltransferase involved in cell wall biosynthesis